MKYIKTYENLNENLFNVNLKKILMSNMYFSKGDVYKAMVDITNNIPAMSYNETIYYIERHFGIVALFSFYLNKYNTSIVGGGHEQYYNNGFAGKSISDIKYHDNFIKLFKTLKINDIEYGEAAYDIICDFKLELKEELKKCQMCDGDKFVICKTCHGSGNIYCKDKSCKNCESDWRCRTNSLIECPECKGSGYIKCPYCKGKGKGKIKINVPKNINYWMKLDSEWNNINNNFIISLNSYLLTLKLNGELISSLVEMANTNQIFNI